MKKNGGTRSGLLWEVERILNECDELPDILLMENVIQVHADRNIGDFEAWKTFLENKGYKNFVCDMNAKDYGIPQNRNRCFMVSVLSAEKVYCFPEEIKLDTTVTNFLEDNVDEKYYINQERANSLTRLLTDNIGGGNVFGKLNKPSTENGFGCYSEATITNVNSPVASTICARYYKGISGDRDNLVINSKKAAE